MLSIAQALEKIVGLGKKAKDKLGSEWVSLAEADHRVLADCVKSSRSLPPLDNSAMDGYAIRFQDGLPSACLRVIAEIPAGSVATQSLGPNQAMRIFTGAPIPNACDAVIMQEHIERNGDDIIYKGSEAVGEFQHIRLQGSDVKEGEVILEAGNLIEPGEIGLLAACGRSGVLVSRRPRVAIISTGDELLYIDQEPKLGQIVNSNALALMAMVRQAGGEPCHFPIVPDTMEEHSKAFERAEHFDLVLTSGGVSVGDHDLIQPCLEQRGWTRSFWKVAMKPGKPVLCGNLSSGTVFLGLPGNPASTMVAFELFGRPLIRTMQNHPRPYRRIRKMPLNTDYSKKTGRTHVLRGSYQAGGFTPINKQGSGMLRSMVNVSSFAFLPSELTDLSQGSLVSTWDLLHDGCSDWPIS